MRCHEKNEKRKKNEEWTACLKKQKKKRKQFTHTDTPSKLKGYPRYKTITSQNASSEAQIKKFFISYKIMFRSQDIVFLTIS